MIKAALRGGLFSFRFLSDNNSVPARIAAMPTNRNLIYLVVGALAVAVVVLSYNLYQARKQPEGVQINIGPGGVSIEKK